MARAEAYPTRPVRMVVPYPAGIAPDIVTRMVAQSLSPRLGQQFIVDDRPGGASNVGTEIVAHAAPDGYTLLTVTMSNAINVSLYDNLSFNLLRDIAPVSGLVFLPLVLAVNPSLPAQTLPEFIAYAKANPGKINYASVGSGAATNVAGELFKQMAGVNIVNVPYRSNYLPDLLSGQVQASFTPILQSIQYIRAGKLRGLAVTGAKRSPSLPDVPTVAEFVPGYEAIVWDGMGAPKNTPADIIDKLNKEINAVLADPATKARFADLGSEPMVMTPAEFGKFVAAETQKWGKVVKVRRHQARVNPHAQNVRLEELNMMLRRRRFLQLASAAAAVPAMPRIARAQAYPDRPVRMIVTVPAGGSPDIIGRLIAQWLSEKLGQPFVVENKPGASTNIGTELALKSAPDGDTLLLAMSSNAINPSLFHHLNFNFIQDAEPVASIATIPLVLDVNPEVPAKTVSEFIAYVKANPGKINLASGGSGTPLYVAGALFRMMAGLDMLDVIYQGEGAAMPDLIGGRVQAMFGVMPASLGYIKSGKLRALAVTSAKRQELLPGVPADGRISARL